MCRWHGCTRNLQAVYLYQDAQSYDQLYIYLCRYITDTKKIYIKLRVRYMNSSQVDWDGIGGGGGGSGWGGKKLWRTAVKMVSVVLTAGWW